MNEKITVTGYGSTAAEAETDANRKINDIRMLDDSSMLAFGAMGLGMRVVTATFSSAG